MFYNFLRMRKKLWIITLLVILLLFVLFNLPTVKEDVNIHDRNSIIKYIESSLRDSVLREKGTGCNIPKLDPYDKEILPFLSKKPKIKCTGIDWVRCHLDKCTIRDELLKRLKNLHCEYHDILHVNDLNYTMGPPASIGGRGVYYLKKSDHVKVECRGEDKRIGTTLHWTGFLAGLRHVTTPASSRDLNILIVGFDSTSRSAFTRKLPRSLKVLKKLDAIILEGYNALGDGTPAALFPILSGLAELEFPDVRRGAGSKDFLDYRKFIFHKLAGIGYHTAYFEDTPTVGTFQYRFNGFEKQPADHYLRSFFLEEGKHRKSSYCVGEQPQYKLLLNITEQVFELDGNKFCFTFIADISHNDINLVGVADDDFADFLTTFHERNGENTLIFVMSDHGARFGDIRKTMVGKFEERLPMMALILPKSLQNYSSVVQANAKVLTTAHDVHATVLDALGLPLVPYKVPGSDLARGLSLFSPIPSSRSCGEAGVESHWCTCVSWGNVGLGEPIVGTLATAAVDYINQLTRNVRDKCMLRTLKSVEWVLKQNVKSELIGFVKNRDNDGYIGQFDPNAKLPTDHYNIKLTVGPGLGMYEMLAIHSLKEDTFTFSEISISRTNAYGNEPSCISDKYPHLNKYCFCAEALKNVTENSALS